MNRAKETREYLNKEQTARKDLDNLRTRSKQLKRTREFGKKETPAEQRRREIERKEPTARTTLQETKICEKRD